MPTATLPSRASIDQIETMECESCSSSMTVTPNPYFGTGLAIHRYIALCNGCHAVAFVPEPVAAPSLIERIVRLVRSMAPGTVRA